VEEFDVLMGDLAAQLKQTASWLCLAGSAEDIELNQESAKIECASADTNRRLQWRLLRSQLLNSLVV
jgi:hypothetical protein